jgi:predicted ATPase
VTTHSPYFVDALQPAQVWVVKKVDGRSTITRAADIQGVRELVNEGLPLGSIWYSQHLRAVDQA